MKREDLKKLELSDEVIDKIMALHGTDIEAHKGKVTAAETELATMKGQLDEAGKTIESFKAMKPEELKAAADDWKAQFEKSQKDAADQLAQVKFDHALEGALRGAKVKNVKAVLPLLDMEAVRKGYSEKDGSFATLEEHLKKVKETDGYLFDDGTVPPTITLGGNNHSVNIDAVTAAARTAAGLPAAK